MNISEFCARFDGAFPRDKVSIPTWWYGNRIWRRFFDPCPSVDGMISIKNQRLLNIAFSCLDADECYLEVGTFVGKSLISAMLGNPERKVYACDNFCQFTPINCLEKLQNNLRRYKLDRNITFYNSDYLEILNTNFISIPVGLYFYDGAHDEDSQYLAIREVEPLLSRNAIVIVDDWRFAEDSESYARAGVEKALAESSHEWKMLYELPARYNGDQAMWWNGVCVFSFSRREV